MAIERPADSSPGTSPCLVPGWSIGFGEVRHHRERPRDHAFRYRSFYLAGDLGDGRRRGNWLFGINRPALISFHEADHGDGRPARQWIDELLQAGGLPPTQTLRFQGFARVFGYAFKPVSFWFCDDAQGQTMAIVAEVNNTFGERHYYLLTAPDGTPLRHGASLAAEKAFPVSPFCLVEGRYEFRFMARGARHIATINYHDVHGLLLRTSVAGVHEPLTRAAAWRALLGYPLFSVGVIVRIHWQALRLVMGRIPFLSRQPAPARHMTIGFPTSPKT